MKHNLLAACLLGPALLLSAGALAESHESEAVAQLIEQRHQQGPKQILEKVTEQYTGVITNFELDDQQGVLVYQVEVIDLANNVKRHLVYDAQTTLFISGKETAMTGWFNDNQNITAIEEIQETGFSMIKALEIVQSQHPGFLVDAELENKKGINLFEIELATPEGKQNWLVDISTQDLIPVYRK
ncbi:PepSY domain-containing protein [Motilimonas cestriensis]|uniref:PepSY domain-containing protein n=1 Tax=Motilimonas cestriensis TaxID=2742685 RepID=A0ABS8W8P5_9GAMM|nr:PepSY domain-containing protein [Motilimonas cestriensis]MCE2593921.1 PepSY domain-containing protein [Motilimonas cestriensis]